MKRRNIMDIKESILSDTHILIAGTTGSGKSVLLNNIIIELYRTNDPYFIFIDIKKVELISYKETYNCIMYADSAEKAIKAATQAVTIIEKRYKNMQRKKEKLFSGRPLYIIIDELADLLTEPRTRKKILPLLCRIGQIGRASNVHLIACTQIPNRNILSSQLRVNFTGIIGLRTAGPRETLNILNDNSIELSTLPKYGYAVYLNSGYKHKFTFNMYNENDVRTIAIAHNKNPFKILLYSVIKNL